MAAVHPLPAVPIPVLFDQSRNRPRQLWRQATDAVISDDKIRRRQLMIFEHEKDFGVDDGSKRLDHIEHVC